MDEVWEPQVRLTTQLRQAMAAEGLASAVRQEAENAVSGVESESARLRQTWARLWSEVERFQANQKSDSQDSGPQLLITAQIRNTKSWADLHLAWENLDVGLRQAAQNLDRLHRFLDSTELPGAGDQPALIMETANLMDDVESLRGQFDSILPSGSTPCSSRCDGRRDRRRRGGARRRSVLPPGSPCSSSWRARSASVDVPPRVTSTVAV